jgi:hypothetical protein
MVNKWASPGNSKYDVNLHKCGGDFVRYLIKKQVKEDFEINKIEADRQWKNIDIWAAINESDTNWCKENNSSFISSGSTSKASLFTFEVT